MAEASLAGGSGGVKATNAVSNGPSRTQNRVAERPTGTSLYDTSSPEPTRRADMGSRSFKSAVTRAHNYTDDNYHQVASATMAKAFGYPDIERGFRDIEKDHMKAGSLTQKLMDRRDKLESELEKRIKRDYGRAGMEAWYRGKS